MGLKHGMMIPVRAGLLSNPQSCGFSSKLFLLLNMEPLLKELCFLLCKWYNIFACLMFYFSNSFLIVSYNCNTRFRIWCPLQTRLSLLVSPVFILRTSVHVHPLKKCEILLCIPFLLTTLYVDNFLLYVVKSDYFVVQYLMLLPTLINSMALACTVWSQDYRR